MRRYVKAGMVATMLGAGASCDAPSSGPAPVAAVTVVPGSVLLQSGADTALVAEVLGPSGAPLVGRTVTWTIADPSVASLAADGEVVATYVLGALSRQTVVTATAGGRTGQATITVAPSAVDTVRLQPLGDPLEDGDAIQLVVTLTDSVGNELTGRSVGWISRDDAVARVSVSGVVRPTPFLGSAPDATWVVASSGARADSVEVVVLPTTVESVAVSPGAPFLAVGWTKRLRARALTGAGAVVDGIDATWESLEPAIVSVSADGQASAQTLGTARIVASALTFSDTVTVTVTSCGAAPAGDYALEVRYVGTPPNQAVQDAFSCAVARLRAAIRGSLSAVTFANQDISGCSAGVVLNESVPGLLILARIEPIDGPGAVLGSAGPCFLRNSNLLPVIGRMRFDEADMAALVEDGSLASVVLHEMLHVLGIGTIWDPGFKNLIAGVGTVPRFTGPLARQACVEEHGGATPCANWVPVEDCAGLSPALGCGVGTINTHWKETVFENELMTGYLDAVFNPFSAMTIQSLADMGYGVDAEQGNDYTIPGAALRARQSRVAVPRRMPEPSRPTHRVDDAGRLIPLLPF
jgi:hypothetical protein